MVMSDGKRKDIKLGELSKRYANDNFIEKQDLNEEMKRKILTKTIELKGLNSLGGGYGLNLI